MLKLRTDCNDCLHSKVCKNKNKAKSAMEKLKNANYGKGPNDDYGWDVISDAMHVNIDFSCLDFDKKGTNQFGVR